ncbi:type II secretion system F family protein [Idiomarina sp. HP20-50]|uniref:type II secretion system F family protein n=1 Tax=Idiomarina sp. HP20-50 TaxID=3070813 RepID=UPI00294ABDB6|nr:type II secretion system F family protein [Idiomarina sp. HP20-50]MDV6315438.1 type II secretion system F family protein [Idiomarina sp. HP20-50]
MFILGLVILVICSGLCWLWILSELTPDRYQKLEDKLTVSTVQSLEEFFLRMPVKILVRSYLVATVIVPVIVWVTIDMSWALPVLVLSLLAPPFLYRYFKKRRFSKIEKQLPGMLIGMSNQLRSGTSVGAALKGMQGTQLAPLGQDIDEILRQEKVGKPLTDCLEDWQRRVPIFSIQLVVQSLVLGLKSGGHQSELFLRLADNLQQQQHIKERQLTLTSQARMQAKILVLMPAGLYFLLSWMKPEHTDLFTESPIGMGMLAVAFILMSIGAWMVKKIMHPDEEE